MREAVLRYQDGLLVIVGKKDRDSQIKIPEVLLTSAGQELFGSIDCPPSRVYLKAFARFLQEKQCRLYVVENTDGICEGKFRISLSSLVEP